MNASISQTKVFSNPAGTISYAYLFSIVMIAICCRKPQCE